MQNPFLDAAGLDPRSGRPVALAARDIAAGGPDADEIDVWMAADWGHVADEPHAANAPADAAPHSVTATPVVLVAPAPNPAPAHGKDPDRLAAGTPGDVAPAPTLRPDGSKDPAYWYLPQPDWRPPERHDPRVGAPVFDAAARALRARGDEPQLLQIPESRSSLVQAASLWLSILAITHSDAVTLAAEDPWAGATESVHADEHGHSARDYLGADGLALVAHFWDLVAPLRASPPSRSLAHCDDCGQWWYIPGGTTQPPRACAMTFGCDGTVHKAYPVLPASAASRAATQKASDRTNGPERRRAIDQDQQ